MEIKTWRIVLFNVSLDRARKTFEDNGYTIKEERPTQVVPNGERRGLDEIDVTGSIDPKEVIPSIEIVETNDVNYFEPIYIW